MPIAQKINHHKLSGSFFTLLTLLLAVVFLSSCMNNTIKNKSTQKTFIKAPIYPPKKFEIDAKLSLINNQNSYFFDLSWKETEEKREVIFSSGSFFWSLNILEDSSGIWVNNSKIDIPIGQWLDKNYGVNLPFNELKQWIFLPPVKKRISRQVAGRTWLVDYKKTQKWQNHLIAKKIHLLRDNLKITVLIKSII